MDSKTDDVRPAPAVQERVRRLKASGVLGGTTTHVMEQFLSQLHVLSGMRATNPVRPTVTAEWPKIPLSPA